MTFRHGDKRSQRSNQQPYDNTIIPWLQLTVTLTGITTWNIRMLSATSCFLLSSLLRAQIVCLLHLQYDHLMLLGISLLHQLTWCIAKLLTHDKFFFLINSKMQQYLRSGSGNTRQNQWQHYMTNNDKTSFHSTLVSMTVKIQMHHGSTWQSPLFIKATARQPLIWWKEHPSCYETASPATGAERSSLEILSNERRPKTTFCWKATDATRCPYKDKGWKLGRGATALLYSAADTGIGDTCTDTHILDVGWGPVLQPSAYKVQLFTEGPPQGCRV